MITTIKIIITSNYDLMLETALNQYGRKTERHVYNPLDTKTGHFGRLMLKINGPRVETLLESLKDNDSYVRRDAASALGKILKHVEDEELLKYLTNLNSGRRKLPALILENRESFPDEFEQEIANLKTQDLRPWVRIAAYDAHEAWQKRKEEIKQEIQKQN